MKKDCIIDRKAPGVDVGLEILATLGVGEREAVSISDLAADFGMQDIQLAAHLDKLRVHGVRYSRAGAYISRPFAGPARQLAADYWRLKR